MVWYGMVWYGIVEFNVPLDTVYVISKTGIVTAERHKEVIGGLSNIIIFDDIE